MVLVAALAAGVSVAAIEAVGERFELPDKFARIAGGNLSNEDQLALDTARTEVAQRNAAVWLGLTGGLAGALFATTLGGFHRAGSRVILGVIGGAVLAGGLGALAGFQCVGLFESQRAQQNVLGEEQIMMLHGLTWGLVGLGLGAGAGLSRPHLKMNTLVMSILVAGLLGGLGGVAFPIVCGMVAPLVNVALPLPEAGTGRLIWIGLPLLLAGLGLSRLR
jgi:hypothetical protein